MIYKATVKALLSGRVSEIWIHADSDNEARDKIARALVMDEYPVKTVRV